MVDLDCATGSDAVGERVGLLCMFWMETINTSLFRLSKREDRRHDLGPPGDPADGERTVDRHAPYTKPLLALDDGDAWVVAASRGGLPRHPDWLLNLRASSGEQAGDLGTHGDGRSRRSPPRAVAPR